MNPQGFAGNVESRINPVVQLPRQRDYQRSGQQPEQVIEKFFSRQLHTQVYKYLLVEIINIVLQRHDKKLI